MKKILLSLASLLIAGGAWAQDYSLTEFEVTTDESQPITYVMESRRPRFVHPDWFLDGVNVKMQQNYTYATAEGKNKNNYLFYFTKGSNGGYYIHPYNAEDGCVLGVASVAANVVITVVDKNNPDSNYPIEWTLGELTDNNVTRPYFKTTIGDVEYCLQDVGSGSHVKLVLNSSASFVSTALNFGKCDPFIPTTMDDLSDLINSFDYKIAYQCLGTETGQFVDTDNAYETAYEDAQAAITAETGDFETLLANVQTAYEALVYSPLPTGKFYTFKSKSTDKYLAPSSNGQAMNMTSDISVFELTTDTWMKMCANGNYINNANHGHTNYHNTNKFYRDADDGSFIIAATPTDKNTHIILKAGDTKLTSVADNAIDDACYWVVEEYAVPAVTIDDANKYATFYAPAAVAVPEGVDAYYVSGVDGNSATLAEIETNIPANTGAILYAEGGKECNFTVVSYNAEDAVSGNLLVGTQSKTTVTKAEGYSYYILANLDGVVGFYNAVNDEDETSFVNAAGKAYLKVADVAGARFLNFNFGGTETAIKDIEGAESNSVVYDLSGRRVQNVTKGLYIVNGKKVVK